jgi:hypothetical protein
LYKQHISFVALPLSLWVKVLQWNVCRATKFVHACWTVHLHLLCETAFICVFTKSEHHMSHPHMYRYVAYCNIQDSSEQVNIPL